MILYLETKWQFGPKSAVLEHRNFAFSPCWWWKKSRAYFSRLKKGHGAFVTSKIKKQTVAPSKRIILNFVKNPLFSYWILWRVHFPHTEFCEESVSLIVVMNRTMCLLKDYISHSLSRGSIYYISRILQGAGCVSDHGGLRRLEAIKCHFWSLLNKYLRQQFITLSSKFMFSRDYFWVA